MTGSRERPSGSSSSRKSRSLKVGEDLARSRLLACRDSERLSKKQEGQSVNARLYIVAFSHTLETSIIFHRFRYMMPYQCNISQNLISYFDPAISVPIKKPYSLHQSALVGDQNGIWILGLYHFVSEEFDHNIANYISS